MQSAVITVSCPNKAGRRKYCKPLCKTTDLDKLTLSSVDYTIPTKLIVALQEYELVISVCFPSIREFVRHDGRLLADEKSIYTEHEDT